MDYSYIFSIILPINNFTSYNLQTLDSIINNQYLGFEDNVQLIILSSDENITSNLLVFVEKYPQNIKILSFDLKNNDNFEEISDHVNGQYILFMKNNIILSDNVLTDLNNIFTNNKLDVVFLLNKELMDVKFFKNGEEIFDLSEDNNIIPLNEGICCVESNIFGKILTQYNCNDFWAIIIKILDVKQIYAISNESNYVIQYAEGISNHILENNEYFVDKLNNFFVDIIEYCNQRYEIIPIFIQEVFIYQLANLIESFDVSSLNENEKVSFFNNLNKVISQLDFNTILYYRHVDSRKKNFLLYLHNECNMLLEKNDDKLDLKIKNHLIDNLNRHKIWIDVIDINDDVLNISGLLQSNFSNDYISINLISQKNNRKKVFNCNILNYTQDERKNISYLSIDWIYRYNFDFEVSIDEIVDSKVYFEITFDNDEILLNYIPEIAFRTPASLSTSSIYQTTDNHILYFKDNSFFIKSVDYPLLLKLELSNLKKIFKDKRKGYFSALFLRVLYVIIYPIMHKRNIWLFNDRLSFADDNALALFDYSVKQTDGIDKYFVISDKSNDYSNLRKEYSNIIKFGSLRHKLLYLFADKLVYSFVNEDYSNPFHFGGNLEYKQLYSGLFSFKRYFLQHGVTLGNVSDSIKKFNMNLSLIVTSSLREEESFKNAGYGYKDDVIQTLGLPRYDKLDKSVTKKQIIFMPTWRSYLNYDESLFKYSKFYKTLSNLLNNPRLHALLEKQGYEFIFKPHPELYKYMDYFTLDNVVLSDEPYRRLFNESALLITDYSSVAFDFAYLKKPVLYYQNSDDYHYKEGYFDFDTMGFGEVVTNESRLISKIEEYINNGCIMEGNYEKRVDDFFNYHDKDNCLRVYSWIKNN